MHIYQGIPVKFTILKRITNEDFILLEESLTFISKTEAEL